MFQSELIRSFREEKHLVKWCDDQWQMRFISVHWVSLWNDLKKHNCKNVFSMH
jgi:hypothetical protein